jgi:anti-sigma B factor antagonist
VELVVDESHPPYTVVTVNGEVDAVSAPSLRARLVELVAEGKVNLIVDLDKVGFLDSSGLGALIGAVKQARAQNGDLAVICTRQHILKVFEITGLAKVFTIHDSLAGAVVG